MSRGGGGWGRGGRRNGFGGHELGFQPDEEKLHELYPERAGLPLAQAPGAQERDSAAQYMAIRQNIREGPFYTGKCKRGKGFAHISVEIEMNSGAVNDGIKRYTDRYISKRKIGRSIDEHPYMLRFFPEELLETIGGKKSGKTKKNERINLAKFEARLLEAVEVENEKEGQPAEGEAEESENSDNDAYDDYEDDDYNAEGYFDDGDGYDDDGGGDDEAYFNG